MSATDAGPHATPTGYPRITPLTVDDLNELMRVEQVAFPAPWSWLTYRREVERNEHGFYRVIRPGDGQPLPPILGYGGYWLLGDDLHITTIATHPHWTRCHLAEWLLTYLLWEGATQGAKQATLEVRVSNGAAIALYIKAGFVQVGRRRRYYPPVNEQHPSEDALLLTRAALGQQMAQLAQREAELREEVFRAIQLRLNDETE